MAADETYDVVVLGSGIAGLAGALAAHELGLKPIVLEKAEKLGGGTTNSYGLIWVGQNHLAQAAGYDDNRDDVIAYMRFLSGGFLDEERMATFVDRGREAIEVLRRLRRALPRRARSHRSLLRHGAGHARSRPLARGGAHIGLRPRRLARARARPPRRALLRHRRGAGDLGRHQQLLALGPGPGARAQGARHARQGAGPHLPFPQRAARARRAGAHRSAGR